MDAFQAAQEDLNAQIKMVQSLTQAVIEATGAPEKKKCQMAAQPALREARKLLSALRAEARRTADPEMRAHYEEVCKQADERIRNLDGEMKNQIYPSRQQPERPKTYQEQREIDMMGAGGVDGSGFQNSQQVLSAAVNVKNDALESLQRTERLQNVTEEQGKATMQQLQKQTEQMYQIDEELQNLQGQIDRASRDVKWFYRQLAGDKCFLVIFGIIVLALVALVFISIWTKRKKKTKT